MEMSLDLIENLFIDHQAGYVRILNASDLHIKPFRNDCGMPPLWLTFQVHSLQTLYIVLRSRLSVRSYGSYDVVRDRQSRLYLSWPSTFLNAVSERQLSHYHRQPGEVRAAGLFLVFSIYGSRFPELAQDLLLSLSREGTRMLLVLRALRSRS